MKNLLITIALGASLNPVQAADLPGMITRMIDAPHHGRKMEIAIWYPGTDGSETTFGENPVFEGIKVLGEAKPRNGKFPVVLLSHGLGGNVRGLNWLAAGLVAKGAVVIAVNHPNSSFRDMDMQAAFRHWTRVEDLQSALANLVQDGTFAPVVDLDRIYAAGFSYGGWTALSMAGVQGKAQASAAYCKAAGTRSSHCWDLEKAGIDLSAYDQKAWSASYKDKRVKAVAAIDPGLTWGLTRADTADVDQTKVLLIGLGTGEDRYFATDTSPGGNNFELAVPEAAVAVVAPANHFSAMPVCKPDGAKLLAEEKDDPVCSDPAGADRSAIHDQIVSRISRHFGLEGSGAHQ